MVSIAINHFPHLSLPYAFACLVPFFSLHAHAFACLSGYHHPSGFSDAYFSLLNTQHGSMHFPAAGSFSSPSPSAIQTIHMVVDARMKALLYSITHAQCFRGGGGAFCFCALLRPRTGMAGMYTAACMCMYATARAVPLFSLTKHASLPVRLSSWATQLRCNILTSDINTSCFGFLIPELGVLFIVHSVTLAATPFCGAGAAAAVLHLSPCTCLTYLSLLPLCLSCFQMSFLCDFLWNVGDATKGARARYTYHSSW